MNKDNYIYEEQLGGYIHEDDVREVYLDDCISDIEILSQEEYDLLNDGISSQKTVNIEKEE